METNTTPADQFLFRMVGEVLDNPNNEDVIDLGKNFCEQNPETLYAMRHLYTYCKKELDNCRALYTEQIDIYKELTDKLRKRLGDD